MDFKMNKTDSCTFNSTASSKKNGFIHLRSINYKKIRDLASEDDETNKSYDPQTWQRYNMKTQFHWIKKPPFSKLEQLKMRTSFNSFYSNPNKKDMRVFNHLL